MTGDNCRVKVALKPSQTLGHIFAKPKDRVTTNRNTHAVYSIPCSDCEKVYMQTAVLHTSERTSKGCF